MKIYVTTSDNHIDAIKPFYYLFNRFWPETPIPEVTILGFSSPNFYLPDNFKFVSLGKQTGVQNWGNDLYNYLDSIDDEHFIMFMEDLWVYPPTNNHILNVLKSKIQTDNKIGRIVLGIDAENTDGHTIVEEYKDFDIIELGPSCLHRISLQGSIWNREYMMKYMKGRNPWKFEHEGTETSRNDGFKILGTKRNHAIKSGNGIGGRNANPHSYSYKYCGFHWIPTKAHGYLDESIKNDMRKENLIP